MKRSIINNRFKVNALFNYATQLFSIGSGFAFVAVVTKYAGVETYGRLAMLSALIGVVVNFASIRSNEAVINFYKRGKVANELGLCKMALLLGMAFDAVLAVMLFGFLTLFAPLIAEILIKDVAWTESVAIYSGIVVATFLRGVPLGLLIAEERFKTVSILSALEQVLKFSIVVVILWRDQALDDVGIIWAVVLSSGSITLLVYFLPIKKILFDLRLCKADWCHLGSYFRFSISTFVSSSLKAGNQGVDVLVIGYFLAPSVVGIFALFRQFLAPMNILAGPFSTQFYPKIVVAAHNQEKREIHHAIVYGGRVLAAGFMILWIFSAAGMVFFGFWTGLSFSMESYISFLVISVATFLNQQLWWARPFSLAVDPRFSIDAGILATMYMVAVYPLFVISLGLFGGCLGVCLLQSMLRVYWSRKLRRYL